jgi:sulfatase modifying factor 1
MTDRFKRTGCCAPPRPATSTGAGVPDPIPSDSATVPATWHGIEQAAVPAQTFAMGDAFGEGSRFDGEQPVHPVTLASFSIDATPVTTADFARFTEATGYRTEAEVFGFSAVFHLALEAETDAIMGPAAGTPWWLGVRGADWAHPGGPRSSREGLDDHPVVHVSWNDAQAYCDWAGRSLPTEAQWEAASRAGRASARYPWGDNLPAREGGGNWPVNIWQGHFPRVNTVEDGWLTTAPVRSFSPNDYGLWQTVGNVWEWCSDWFDATWYSRSPSTEPVGPASGHAKVMRGGSYLCHDSYCNRYRNAARSSNTPDSSTGNIGFRTVSRPA